MTSGKRARIGDVLEFSLPDGLHYAQYTHRHPMYGHLLRVMEGAHSERPRDLAKLADVTPGYFAFTFVPRLLRFGMATIVWRGEVPERHRPFPLFKAASGFRPGGKRTGPWWLWDGQSEWKVGDLKPEWVDLPLREIESEDLFLQSLGRNWHPRDVVWRE